MHRIDGAGATLDNKFTQGNPATATPATTVTDAWLNDMQEEIASVPEAVGIPLAKGQLQLLRALGKLSPRLVDSIADLRALDKTKFTRALVIGYYSVVGAGGGGVYWYDSADTTTADNGGTVIVAADGGRWKLASSAGRTLSVRWFGAKGDGVTDDTAAIEAAANAAGYGGSVAFPKGTYLVTSTVVLRGATKLLGEGVEASIIYRTGDYGDTFRCGTVADQSEPARSFEARGLCFRHSDNYVSGSATMPNKATSGAHLRLYGAQEAMIYDCWFWRLPYGIASHGGSWVKVVNCQFQGVYDSETVGLQEGIAGVAALYSAVHGNPTTWIVKGCNFLGATRTRDITYAAASGNVVVNRVDTIGPLYGLYIDGLEDADISGNYFGGQSVAEIAVVNAASSAVVDIRITRNFFDGCARGQGVLFAPTVANTLSLAVTIEGNIFTDNKNAIYINQNAGSGTPSVYDLTLRGNVCLSGIATQFRLDGAKGFVCSGNTITDYNKHNISATDLTYMGAIVAGGVSANGLIKGNTVGGGGNTLVNDAAFNFCYVGVSIAGTLTSVVGRNNFYNGIRSGANFRTGLVVDSNQYTITAGAYQMTASDSVVLVNKTANETTAAALPLYPCEGREIIVKDAKGNAATYNTTITTNDGTTIDGAATFVINTNYGYVRLRFNGSGWDRIG